MPSGERGAYERGKAFGTPGGETMKSLARIKTPALCWPIDNKEEVDEAIRRIGELQRERPRIETEMNDELATVKKSYEQKAEQPTEELRSLRLGSVLVRESSEHAHLGIQGGKVLNGRSELEKAL